MRRYSAISLEEIQLAQRRLTHCSVRTPLIKLEQNDPAREIYLKIESLQPMSSFKIRGAGNLIESLDHETLVKGVWTASAGNMALAVGWHARRLKIKSTAIVSELTPESKLQRIRYLESDIIKIPFQEWVEIIKTHQYSGMEGTFVHPVSDLRVMAGNGTIGLEILEDLAEVDAVVMPYGLGGLCCGVASTFRSLKPSTKLFACETDAASPFAASLAQGEATEVAYNPSFVDAMGAPMLLPEMWALAKELLDDSLVCSLEEVVSSIRLLAEEAKLVTEGAGAVALAAALAGKAGDGKVVCIISGGNINTDKFIKILHGEIPS